MPVNGIAPSCPVSHSQPTQKPRKLAVDVSHIPPARDLRSVITAINMMNNVVQHITRGQPQINNVYPATEEGVPAPTPPPPPQYAKLVWQETGRGYTQQHVVNPDDTEQKVPIKTLSHVNLSDQVVRHKLTYRA